MVGFKNRPTQFCLKTHGTQNKQFYHQLYNFYATSKYFLFNAFSSSRIKVVKYARSTRKQVVLKKNAKRRLFQLQKGPFPTDIARPDTTHK